MRVGYQGGGTPAAAVMPTGPVTADDPRSFDQIMQQDVQPDQPTGRTPATTGKFDIGSTIDDSFGPRADYARTISSRESSMGKNWVGDDGSSFGDFQLHYGGISSKYPHAGLGEQFTADTGLDARNRDPQTRQAVADWVADYTAKHGWHDWSTAKDAPRGAGGPGWQRFAGPQGGDDGTMDPRLRAEVPPPGGAPASPGRTPGSYSSALEDAIGRKMLAEAQQGQPQQHPGTDIWGTLIATGGAMMAGTSPYAAVNIGKGLQAGAEFSQKQSELARGWAETDAKVRSMSYEDIQKGLDIELGARKLDMLSQLYGQAMGQGQTPAAPPAPSAGAAAPSGGVQPIRPMAPMGQPGSQGAPQAGAAAPAGGAAAGAIQGQPAAAPGQQTGPPPENDPFWRTIPVSENPYWLNKMGIITGNQEMIKHAGEIWQSGYAGGTPIPGVMGTAQRDVYKKSAEEFYDTQNKFMRDYDRSRDSLKGLADIYTKMQTGRPSEIRATLSSWAANAGFGSGAAAGYDAARKTAIDFAYRMVSDTGMARAPRAALKEALMASPHPENDPGALRNIITKSVAALDYNRDMMASVPSGAYDTNTPITQFVRTHNFHDYEVAARDEIPLFKNMSPDQLNQGMGGEEQIRGGRAIPSTPPALEQKFAQNQVGWSPSLHRWVDTTTGARYTYDGRPG